VNMNKNGFINIVFVILVIILIGAVGYFIFLKKLKTVQAPPQTPSRQQNETMDWKTYQNTRFNLSIKYPNDWRLIDFQSVKGMGTLDTFGFIPSTVKNSYCDIEQEISFLVQNYKTYNPFPNYEEYAYNLAKTEFCSIQVRIEKNLEKSTIKDYLKKVYIPLASNINKEKMEERINDLTVMKDNGVEQSRNNYAFIKYLGGIDGSYPEVEIFENKSQVIINTEGNILFVTNHINKSVDQRKGEDLFEKIVRSFQVLQ